MIVFMNSPTLWMPVTCVVTDLAQTNSQQKMKPAASVDPPVNGALS